MIKGGPSYPNYKTRQKRGKRLSTVGRVARGRATREKVEKGGKNAGGAESRKKLEVAKNGRQEAGGRTRPGGGVKRRGIPGSSGPKYLNLHRTLLWRQGGRGERGGWIRGRTGRGRRRWSGVGGGEGNGKDK